MWQASTTETTTEGDGRFARKQPVALKSKYFQPPGAGRRSSLASVTDSESEADIEPLERIDETEDHYDEPQSNGRISPTSRPVPNPTIDAVKAESFDSPVDVRPPRSTALTSGGRKHTSTLIDTAKWGVRYNVKEVQGRSSPPDQDPPLPPGVQDLRDQGGRSASLTLTDPPRVDPPRLDPPRSHSAADGLLRPGNFPSEPTNEDDREEGDMWEDESQASWQQGDDGAAAKRPPPPREPSPEKAKIQMPLLPPKLPLLYFEQDHSIGQIDFAYQQAAAASKAPRSDTSKDEERDQQPTPVADVNGNLATKKPSPRPSPPPIDTSIGQRNAQRAEEQAKLENPPAQQQQPDKKGEDQGDSFFWGSPRSSTDGNSPKQRAEPANTASEKPAKKADPNVSSLVSSSALGFGGPSDWEHFGDYDAEEVDDIDLYTSNREKTAELPTETTPLDAEPPEGGLLGADDLGTLSPGRLLGERKILSTIEERASENLEDLFVERKIENQHGEKIDANAVFNAHPPPPPPRDQEDRDSKTDIRSSGASTSTETINRISFDVPPPPESAQSETSSRKSHTLEEHRHSTGSGKAKAPTPGSSSISSDSTADNGAKSVEDKPKIESRDSKADPTDGIKTAHTSTALSSTFSPTSDDGKEDIIISLQVPGQRTSASPAPLDLDKVRQARESQQAEQPKSPDMLRSGRKSIYPGSVELENPYEGLEVWAKASLNRYVKMLREEAKAESDEDKYMTVANFLQKELRTRAVFYDMEDDSDSDHPVIRAPSKKKRPEKDTLASAPPLPSTTAPVSKALPALPLEPEPTPGNSPPKQGSPPPAKEQSKPREANGSADTSEPTPPAPAVQTNHKNRESKSEAKEKDKGLRGAPSLNALRKALDIVATRKGSLTPRDAQSLSKAAGQPDRAAFNADKPSQEPKTNGADVKTAEEPAPNADLNVVSPDGTSNEGKPYEGDKAANRQSIYQPFSAMLRQSSIKSGTSEPRTSQNFNSAASFVGSEGKLTPHARNPKPAKQSNYRYTVLEPLIAVVPQGPVLREEPEQLVRLRIGMEAIPDDFSFIHKTVLAWDADAKKAREQYDLERQARVSQSEQHVDELFNQQAISYSDIPRLEEDFKRSEAAKKAEEDREEVNTFVSSVFDVVWARINYEMDQLSPLYDECTRLVAEASAGHGMFEADTTAAVPIAPAMEALLTLYQKLMMRHQKAFEAVLERDRRLKKVEVAPWYAVGQVDKVKKIEKRFEDAEKKAILEFCRQRDERANLLMEVLDHNTLRGVGANQDYMESVMQAVHKICESLTAGSVEESDLVSTDEVLKAKTITTALARSSEQIVRTFHVADMLLNAADYEVSVANAKLNGADAAAFRRLRDAKGNEDNKLALDLEHRMGLIRGDTARTQDEINKLLMLIEERQGGPRSAKDGVDPEREERFREALEEAKRRTNVG